MPEPISRVMVATTWALAQCGASYVLGAKPRLDEMHVEEADCSGFARTAVAITGVKRIAIPGKGSITVGRWHGTWAQSEWVKPVSVSYALAHAGHFLLRRPQGNRYGHIALTLRGRRTVEARGRAFGICVVSAEQNEERRRSGFWTDGGKVSELFEPWEGWPGMSPTESFAAFVKALLRD